MKYAVLFERKPNFRATEWSIYFCPIRIQTWSFIAVSFQQSDFSCESHERRVLFLIKFKYLRDSK